MGSVGVVALQEHPAGCTQLPSGTRHLLPGTAPQPQRYCAQEYQDRKKLSCTPWVMVSLPEVRLLLSLSASPPVSSLPAAHRAVGTAGRGSSSAGALLPPQGVLLSSAPQQGRVLLNTSFIPASQEHQYNTITEYIPMVLTNLLATKSTTHCKQQKL